MNKNQIYLFVCILLLWASACNPPEKEYVAPKIWTMQPIEITTAEATFRANFMKGSEAIKVFGFEWKATLEEDWQTVHAQAGTGGYSLPMVNLKEEIQYTVKAFIVDASNNKYFGEEKRFYTGGTLTDIDGNVYSTLRYGNKVWMTENLRVTRYADGTPVEGRSEGPIENGDGPVYYWNGEHTPYFMEPNFGLLYNYVATTGGASSLFYRQGVCPDGWRMPSGGDWMELVSICEGTENMKTKTWRELGYTNANSSRFSIEPAGYYTDFDDEGFRSVYFAAYFWPCTFLFRDLPGVHCFQLGNSAMSIRCVKDCEF
ncbi:MAG: fibrobacter succinogenes major paralogous domain-containing protein [Lentimicrobiaceae bacterium]|nr:fibrobacter succinogenes major paralogous domain-containing protein [Lentimicrobiaceae bacterium]